MPPPAGVDKRVGLIDALAGTGESHLERYRRICRRAKVPEQVPNPTTDPEIYVPGGRRDAKISLCDHPAGGEESA